MEKLNLVFCSQNPACLETHPRIKCCLCYNESLPAELVKKLVKRGQLELIFEPALALIPDEDKLGQIKLMNQLLKENFFKPAQGVCLAGGAFEPHYPKILKQAEIEYALVDEELFDQPAAQAQVTEYEGDKLVLFPVSRNLSQFRSPDEVITYLKQLHEDGQDELVVILEDGETAYSLEKLFSLFETNIGWLELTTPLNYLEDHFPEGLVYLAGNGADFYRCLIKDPEANNRHKKILQVSRQLRVAGSAKSLFGRHEKEQELEKARKHLYQAQQGQAVYKNLILAEVELDKIKHGHKPFVELVITDFDLDGRDEVILANNLLSLYFSPQRGGSLFELDYKPKAVNLLLGRSLVDHLVGEALAPYDFMPQQRPGEVGVRFSRSSEKVKLEKTISLLPNQSLVAIEYDLSGELDGLIFGLEFNLKLVDETKDFAVLLDFSQKPSALIEGSALRPQWSLSGADWKLKINLRIE